MANRHLLQPAPGHPPPDDPGPARGLGGFGGARHGVRLSRRSDRMGGMVERYHKILWVTWTGWSCGLSHLLAVLGGGESSEEVEVSTSSLDLNSLQYNSD